MKAVPYIALVVIGGVVATVGTTAHRAYPWWGIAGAILMVLAAAVYARSWKRFSGLLFFALGWFAAALGWSITGPGGSVLVEADALGMTWLYGGAGAIVVAALIPRPLLEGTDVQK